MGVANARGRGVLCRGCFWIPSPVLIVLPEIGGVTEMGASGRAVVSLLQYAPCPLPSVTSLSPEVCSVSALEAELVPVTPPLSAEWLCVTRGSAALSLRLPGGGCRLAGSVSERESVASARRARRCPSPLPSPVPATVPPTSRAQAHPLPAPRSLPGRAESQGAGLPGSWSLLP